MKRILSIFLAFVLAAPLAGAQGKVSTRKYRLADFPDKVTQVVLTGSPVLSDALRAEVVTGWTASPFEFCSLEQFEALKTDENYYFLMPLETRFKGETTPGITFLTLLKGGPEAQRGIGAMHEVAALPLQAALGGNGEELVYLGALVAAIQEYTLDAMESELVAYSLEGWAHRRYARLPRGQRILLADDGPAADAAFLSGSANTLVGYVVAPVFPEKGSYCYKMLFEASTHSLCYLSRHRITAQKGAEFLPEELKRLRK